MLSSLPPSFEFDPRRADAGELKAGELDAGDLDAGDLDSGEMEWLAFCYVTDELEESDRLGFEERLAEDQQAREAVARAVELTSSLQAAQSLATHVALRTTPSRERMWASIALCASLLAVLLTFVYFQNGRQSLPTEQVKGSFPSDSGGSQIAYRPASENLPEIWADVQGEFPVNQSDLWQPETAATLGVGADGGSSMEGASDQDDDSSMASPLNGLVETEEAHLITPAWMLTALTSDTDSGVGSGNENVEEEKP